MVRVCRTGGPPMTPTPCQRRRWAASRARRHHQARSSAADGPCREDHAGLGIEALAPAAEQQAHDPGQVRLGIPIAGQAGEVVRVVTECPAPAVPFERRAVLGDDRLRPCRERAAVGNEEPAKIDRDRCPQRHLPVDEADPVLRQQRDVGELEIAVQADGRQTPERGDKGRGVLAKVVDELSSRLRRAPVERVPAREEPLAHGVAIRRIPRRRRPGQQRQPFRERAPRRRRLTLAFARRLEHPAPRHRVEPRDRLDDPPERRIVDHRVVPGPLPGDELGRQVGHEDRHALAVGRGAEVGDRRARQPGHDLGRAGREPALTQVVVARRAGDPVLGERGPLQDVVPAARDRRGR